MAYFKRRKKGEADPVRPFTERTENYTRFIEAVFTHREYVRTSVPPHFCDPGFEFWTPGAGQALSRWGFMMRSCAGATLPAKCTSLI